MQRSLDFYIKGIGMVKTGNFTINAEFGKRGGLTGGEAVDVNILKLENSPESTDWKDRFNVCSYIPRVPRRRHEDAHKKLQCNKFAQLLHFLYHDLAYEGF
jgi:hypothetical protein